LVVLAVGCSEPLTTETPRVDSLEPAALCERQATTLSIVGANFAALPRSVFGPLPTVSIPSVEVVRTRTLQGKAVSGSTPARLDASGFGNRVRWYDQAHIDASITVGDGLAAGIYDVSVINPGGTSTRSAGAMAVLAAPTKVMLSPATLCLAGRPQRMQVAA